MNFTKEKIIGGTLIEYVDNTEFCKEWNRSTITGFSLNAKSGIKVKSDGKAQYSYPNINNALIAEVNGIFYIRHTDGYFKICYVIAPKGIVIETPFKHAIYNSPCKFDSIANFIKV